MHDNVSYIYIYKIADRWDHGCQHSAADRPKHRCLQRVPLNTIFTTNLYLHRTQIDVLERWSCDRRTHTIQWVQLSKFYIELYRKFSRIERILPRFEFKIKILSFKKLKYNSNARKVQTLFEQTRILASIQANLSRNISYPLKHPNEIPKKETG